MIGYSNITAISGQSFLAQLVLGTKQGLKSSAFPSTTYGLKELRIHNVPAHPQEDLISPNPYAF